MLTVPMAGHMKRVAVSINAQMAQSRVLTPVPEALSLNVMPLPRNVMAATWKAPTGLKIPALTVINHLLMVIVSLHAQSVPLTEAKQDVSGDSNQELTLELAVHQEKYLKASCAGTSVHLVLKALVLSVGKNVLPVWDLALMELFVSKMRKSANNSLQIRREIFGTE